MSEIDDKGTILIIDNTVSIIDMLKTALLIENYQVLIAATGNTGIISAQKAQPDLILLNSLMPEMDGYETCSRLKNIESTKEIPVIFMSSLAEVVEKVRAFELGAIDYITKPINIEELIVRVKAQIKLYQLQKQLKKTNQLLEQKVFEQSLQVPNEELQITEEDLKERNEELQAAEEELQASNDALRESNEQLYESEQRLQLLSDLNTEGIAIHQNGVIIDVNKAFCDIFGFNKKELLGINPIPTMFPEKGAKIVKENIEKGLNTPYVVEAQKTDKTTIWVEIEARNFRYRNTDARATAFRDITDKVKQEQLLRTKNEELQAAEEELKAINDELINNINLLSESQKLFSSTVNDLLIGVVVHNADTSIALSNPLAQKMLGLSADQMQGKKAIDPAWKFVMEDETPAKFEDYPVNKVINSGKKIENYILGIYHPKRESITWVAVSGIPVFNHNKELDRVIVNFMDISKQKEAEKKRKEAILYLEHEQNLLHSLMNNIPDTIYFKNTQSKFIRINKAKADQCGLKSTDDAIGKTDFDFASKEHANQTFSDEQEIIKTSLPLINKVEKTHFFDGKVRWISTTKVPLCDKNDKVTGIVGISRDITDQKIAELKRLEAVNHLEHERNLLQSLMNNMPDTIYFKDTESKFTRINKAQAKLLGVKNPEDAIDKSDFDFFTSQHAQAAFSSEQEILKSGKPLTNYIEEIKDKNGETRWLTSTKVPLFDENNKVTGLVGITRDVTQIKQTEIALQIKNKELEWAEHELININSKLHEKVMNLVESERKLNEAQKLAKFGYYNLDFNTGIWKSSEELDRIFGINNNFERNVEGWVKIIHPDFKQEMQDYFLNNILKDHENFDKEYKIINQKTKHEYWVHGQGSLEFNDQGNLNNMVGYIQDISQQVLAKKQLVNNQKQLQLIFDSSPAIMFLVNERAEIIRMNKTGFEFLGTSMDLISGAQPGDAFNCIVAIQNKKGCGAGYACNKCTIRNTITKAIETKIPQNKVEAKLNIVKLGRIQTFTVLLSSNIATKVPDLTYLVTIDDITERKKTEKAIVESEKRFRTIIETANDAIFIANAKTGLIVEVNNKGQELIGRTKGEIIGMHQSKLHPNDKIEESKASFAEDANQQKDSIVRQVDVQNKDGRIIPVEVSPALLKLSDNEEYVVGFFRDITKRKIAEKAIEESKDRFKQLADTTNEGIVIHQNGEILDVNNSLLRLSGNTEEEVIGKNVFDLFIPKKYHKITKEKMQFETTGYYEIEALRKDGSHLPVEVSARNISKQNNKIRVITIRDIAEQKQMQQKILQAVINTEEQERKRVAQELHDGLGPILSASKLYVETFLRTNSQTYKEKAQKNLLSGIEEALRQVAAISNNLSPHVLNDFGLEAAVKKFIDRVMSLNAIHIEFTFAYKHKIPNDIETTLYRITTELVNNTLKYAKAEHVFIHIYEINESICLLYKDDGIGFDFEKTKRKKGGMGLFNITSRVESFNGTLSFEKPMGRGIIYTISLPVKSLQ